jgi:general stress protein 26
MEANIYFYNFLNSHKLAVISTVNEDTMPESAVVGFGQTKALELVIGTDNSFRKYKNLKSNQKVSLVIGWDDGETIQFEGTARELQSDEIDMVKNTYWIKSPQAEAQYKNPGQRYFLISPHWIRHTDLKTKPWTIREATY